MVQRTATANVWTINRIWALIVGIVFALLGIIGFFTPAENGTGVQAVLGIFDSDTVHNVFFLLVGLLGIVLAFTGQARTFNQVFGVILTLIGLLGLISALYFPSGTYGTDAGLFLGITHNNAGDHILHLITGIVCLIIGFVFAGSIAHATPTAKAVDRDDL